MRKIAGLVLIAGGLLLLPVSPVGRALADHPDGCIDCHLPHHAAKPTDPDASWGVPLWSTAHTSDGLPTFTLYNSKSFDALNTDIGQPDGPSKLCLGCHDGSYPGFDPGDSEVFGVDDLTVSHPISFTYDSALAASVVTGDLNDPMATPSGLGGTIDEDLLDAQHKMQCTSCHDVHASGYGDALLKYDVDTLTSNALCQVCHDK